MSLLSVDRLVVAYGGVVAVRGLSLSVEEGETLALLGANGAGKTSTLLAISGMVRPKDGEITFDGRHLNRLAPDEIARLGIAHVPAGRGIFGSMTVADNLRMGLYGAGVEGTAEGRRRVDEVLGLFSILAERRDQAAGTMSGGQQQQLAIARAIVQGPRLLMLDEMSMGLAPQVVADLFRIVEGLQQRGMAIVMVEQFVGEALRIADRAAVLEQGRVIASGTAEELRGDDLAAAYLGVEGHEAKAVVPPAPAHAQETVRVNLAGRQVRDLERLAQEQGTTVDALVARALGDVLQESGR